MRNHKALTSFAKVKDNDLVEKSNYIVAQMKTNINYPTPTPELQVVETAIAAYQSAYKKSRHGSKEDTAFKNEKRKELQICLSGLGNYVNAAAQGNLVKLESSGFAISKDPEPRGYLPAPSFLNVVEGDNPGEVYTEIYPVPKATGYVMLYSTLPAPEDNDEWRMKTFSMSKNYIVGLKSGARYAFKAAACSPEADKAGIYNFTPKVEKYIQ